MAVLSVQHTTGASGLTVTFGAAAGGGDTFVNTKDAVLEVINGGGGSITVTVAAVGTCSQGYTHNLAVSVGAGVHKRIGPFSSEYQTSAGVVSITYSGVSSVTVAVTAP